MKKQGVPFSARAREASKPLPVGFPDTARRGVLHIVSDLVQRRFVTGWRDVARELGRIARVSPTALTGVESPKQSESLLLSLEWEKAVDFCERLHSYLSVAVYDHDDNRYIFTREEVQQFIAEELQRLFLEEALPFEFVDGCIHRRGRRHTVESMARAQAELIDPRLDAARTHYRKAQGFFQNPRKPDYENCVKEAVCALEAAGKALFPQAGAATLDDLIKWLTANGRELLPKAVAKSITGLYAFRGGGDGIVHGGTTGGAPTAGIAEFALSTCASAVILLVDVARQAEGEVPF